MNSCPACGLPVPAATATCAFCGLTLQAPEPLSFRLDERAGGFEWSRPHGTVASATVTGGIAELRRPDRGEPAILLAPMGPQGDYRVALLGPGEHPLGTVTPCPGGATLTRVCDETARLLLLVRSDGPTGLHVIDQAGDVVALASRDRRRPGVSLDVLAVRPAGDDEVRLFAVLLATEMLRTGGLRPLA